jgi:hypothetical protein
MKFLSVTLMLSLASATLASDPSLQMRGRLLQKRNRKNKTSGRKLQDPFQDPCTFEAVVASECSISDYCNVVLQDDPDAIAANCRKESDNTFFVNVTYPSTCEDGPYDEATFVEGDYCYGDINLLNFDSAGVLTTEEWTQYYTQPYQGTIRHVLSYDVCPDQAAYVADPDGKLYGGVAYCRRVLCPDELQVNEMACEEGCGACDEGAGIWDCSGVDPTIVSECGAGDFYTLVRDFFQGTTLAPTPVPIVTMPPSSLVGATTEAPVSATTEAPVSATTGAPVSATTGAPVSATTGAPMASPTPDPPTTSAVDPRKQAMTFAFAMVAMAMLL